MQVLLYAIDFAPRIGGEETWLLLLADGLTRPEGEPAVPSITPATVTLVTRTPGDPDQDARLPYRVVRRPSFRKLWRLVGKADVVHVSGAVLLPLALALLRRKPLVIEHHVYTAVCPTGSLFHLPTGRACIGYFRAGRHTECLRCHARATEWWKSGLAWLAMYPRRWLCRRAHVNVAVTEHAANRLDLPRVRTVYHGIPDLRARTDRAPYTGDPSADGNTNDAGVPRIAYVGRFVPEKGLALLLECARRLKSDGHDFLLKLIGDGPERSRLERLRREYDLQDSVLFTGFRLGGELRAELVDVVAVVMPSLWEETAGLAAIEQMSRGRLVVAAAIGGLQEVVGQAALTFPAGDADALTAVLSKVLRDRNVGAGIGAEARARALTRFDYGRMVREHAMIYAEVCGSEPSARKVP